MFFYLSVNCIMHAHISDCKHVWYCSVLMCSCCHRMKCVQTQCTWARKGDSLFSQWVNIYLTDRGQKNDLYKLYYLTEKWDSSLILPLDEVFLWYFVSQNGNSIPLALENKIWIFVSLIFFRIKWILLNVINALK